MDAPPAPPVGTNAPPPPEGAAPGGAQGPRAGRSTITGWSTGKLKRTLRLANMCNGLSLITLGILVFIVGLSQLSFTSVTVSAYSVFFGLLLSCLECNIANLARPLQRNFGFMFSFAGRTFFIVFCGSMAFAMGNWLGYLVGSLTLLNGMFNGYVICVHPAFKSGELSAQGDPYGGYTGGEKEMLAYLQTKPELAAKAQGAALSFARDNPDVVSARIGPPPRPPARLSPAAHLPPPHLQAMSLAQGALAKPANNAWGAPPPGGHV